jgi:sulfur relay (sulfurtransferase) complex TusBCD TusD component (DsrE family)
MNMRINELNKAVLKDTNPSFKDENGELFDAFEELKKSKCVIIRTCKECPNFRGSITPKPGCSITNQIIDNINEFPEFCPYSELGEWFPDILEDSLKIK